MKQYVPPFTLTPEILDLCTRIAELTGRYDGFSTAGPEIRLRKINNVKTIQGTVAIEGNRLTNRQITALLEGKRVIGPEREIMEAKNAAEAYGRLKTFDVYSLQDLLEAHQMLMKNLIADAGKFRSGLVAVLRANGKSHVAPPARLVAGHMTDLFVFLRDDQNTHPLIKAPVFHYELEFIHPFSDGNGRIGRLWEHALLTAWNPVFEFLSIESMVKKNQAGYYAALEKSDKKGQCEDFIEFELRRILLALEEFMDQFRPTVPGPVDRLAAARDVFGVRDFSRHDYMKLFKSISSATASRDLSLGVRSGQLVRMGDRRTARYAFTPSP